MIEFDLEIQFIRNDKIAQILVKYLSLLLLLKRANYKIENANEYSICKRK